MGGARKELLATASGETIAARWERLFAEVGVRTVIVGGGANGALVDEGDDAGPIGGVAALLAHAGEGFAISIAGDMPFVTRPMIARLVRATPRTVLAPRRDRRWEPFFAIWNARVVLPIVRAHIASGALALHALLDAAAAEAFALDDDEARNLFDWDAPADVDPSGPPT
ncbi:hypothetical protein BH09MYX1_BH09MYX1_50640 [soil metagenome]